MNTISRELPLFTCELLGLSMGLLLVGWAIQVTSRENEARTKVD